MPKKGKEEQSLKTAKGFRVLDQYMVINGVVVTRNEWRQVQRNGEDTEGTVSFHTGKRIH